MAQLSSRLTVSKVFGAHRTVRAEDFTYRKQRGPLTGLLLPALTAQRSSLLTVSKVLGAHRAVRAGFFKFLTPEWV